MVTWDEWRAKQTPQDAPSHNTSHWRSTAAKVIAEAMVGFSGNEQELRALLREAYPFGERKMWPYKRLCLRTPSNPRLLGQPHEI